MRTKNQETVAAIEKFISDYVDENGRSPSMQEVADAVGIAKSNAHTYITYMRENGILAGGDGHRSIVTKKEKQSRSQMLRVPVLGAVASVS